MFEPLYYAAYLSRYLSVIVFVYAVWRLFSVSLRSLRRRFRRQRRPVKGFFLLSEEGGAEGQVASFPLYFTTLLGRSRSADLRLLRRNILRRHAQIYLFKGYWHLTPVSPEAKIWLNDEELRESKRLKNGDRLHLPGISFTFVDERCSAREQGVDFEETWTEGEDLEEDSGSMPRGLWPAISLWYFLALFQNLAVLHEKAPFYLLTYAVPALLFFALLALVGYLCRHLFRHFDEKIFAALALLSSFGLLLQMRLSLLNRGQPPDWTDAFWQNFLQRDLLKQAIFAFAGLILLPLAVGLVARSRLPERLAPFCMLLTPLLYLGTKVLGKDVGGTGAGLWIVLPGGLTIQLSEFAKISYLFVLAWFFMIRPDLRQQFLFAAWAGVNFLLILLLPDLGSLMVLLPVTLLVFTVMTSEYFKSLTLLGGASILFFLAWRFFPYVQRRLHGWSTLWTEVNAQNDQIIRGLQAIGRGGFFGRGVGTAEPRAIPLASSDMIFAFLSEEAGLITALALVLLFFIFWLRAAYAVLILRDGFSSSLILALASCFFVEAAVVIGGCTGLIPLTGATLPFIARGGSSMMAKWLMAGLLLGLWTRREEGAYHK